MKKRIIIISVVLFFLVILIPFAFTAITYEGAFGSRLETPISRMSSIEDFDGLMREKYTFASNKNQELVGYKYYKEDTNPKGLVIVVHGLGAGHNLYMNVADYFTSNGYAVFAYDGTGNDESAGDSAKGLPQGIIDLDYAINFVKGNDDFKDLPIMLFGHSMGGYSVGSILNLHQDISAIAMISAFNKSNTLFCDFIKGSLGSVGNIFLPYVSLYEKIKFGSYSSYSCMAGFENTETGVIIIHSKDDNVILYENNFSLFKENYENNPRFEFIDFDTKGHEFILQKDTSQEYWENFRVEYKDYFAANNIESTQETRDEYFSEHLDLPTLYDLDVDLMTDILNFFDEY